MAQELEEEFNMNNNMNVSKKWDCINFRMIGYSSIYRASKLKLLSNCRCFEVRLYEGLKRQPLNRWLWVLSNGMRRENY